MMALKPNEDIVKHVWKKVKDSKGIWSQLDGGDFEHFQSVYMNSDLLIYLGFGMGRITHLSIGHSCRVHGIFWSKDVYKKLGDVAIALMNTANGLHLKRIECVVPSDVRSLERFMKKLGFKFEGRMAFFFKGKTSFFDGDLYAITF